MPRRTIVKPPAARPALAVADQADALGVDLFSRFQIANAGEHVAGEIFQRALLQISGGFPYPAVVYSKHGNPGASQMIRNHQERLVAEDCLVAILRAR